MLTLVEKKIAVEPIFEPDKIGSIFIPDQAKSRANQGIVKYIGPGVTSVAVGDHILFGGYIGTTIHLEGEGTLIVVEEPFVQAVIHDGVTNVPGLFFKDKQGNFFSATYEMAVMLLREAVRESEIFKRQLKGYKPNEKEED